MILQFIMVYNDFMTPRLQKGLVILWNKLWLLSGSPSFTGLRQVSLTSAPRLRAEASASPQQELAELVMDDAFFPVAGGRTNEHLKSVTGIGVQQQTLGPFFFLAF